VFISGLPTLPASTCMFARCLRNPPVHLRTPASAGFAHGLSPSAISPVDITRSLHSLPASPASVRNLSFRQWSAAIFPSRQWPAVTRHFTRSHPQSAVRKERQAIT